MDCSQEQPDYNGFVVDICSRCHRQGDLKCSSCNISSYCSITCQRFDWEDHQILMQCSKKKKLVCKDHPDKNTNVCQEPSDSSSSSPISNDNLILEVKNKVIYKELLDVQIILTHAFLCEGK